MFPVRLGREYYRPGAVFTDHGAGNGAAAAVFDLDGRARLAGAAKGWVAVVRDLVCAQHALLVTRFIRQQEGRRRAFNVFCIINDFCFSFAVTAVCQQCPDGTAA